MIFNDFQFVHFFLYMSHVIHGLSLESCISCHGDNFVRPSALGLRREARREVCEEASELGQLGAVGVPCLVVVVCGPRPSKWES